MTQNKTFTEFEMRCYFNLSEEIKQKALEIILLTECIADNEYVIRVDIDDIDNNVVNVETEITDGYECYPVPIKYFSMTEEEIKKDLKQKMEQQRATDEDIQQIRESQEFKEYLKLKKYYAKYDTGED